MSESRPSQRCILCQTVSILALVLTAGCRSVPPLHPATAEESKAPLEKGPIHVASTSSRMIHYVRPIYPKAAKKAHIEGTVRFEVLISKTGELREIHLVSGDSILVPAALEAVKQWRYAPTLLNGEPVEVKTTVDINFTLNQ